MPSERASRLCQDHLNQDTAHCKRCGKCVRGAFGNVRRDHVVNKAAPIRSSRTTAAIATKKMSPSSDARNALTVMWEWPDT